MEDYIKWVVAVVVPLLGLLLKFRSERQDPGSIRRMKRHSQLLDGLPETAKEPLEALLTVETELYAKRMKRRALRKVDKNNLAALIVAAVLFAGILFGLIAWAQLWGWAWILVGVVGLGVILVLGVGLGQFYEYPESDQDDLVEEKSV